MEKSGCFSFVYGYFAINHWRKNVSNIFSVTDFSEGKYSRKWYFYRIVLELNYQQNIASDTGPFLMEGCSNPFCGELAMHYTLTFDMNIYSFIGIGAKENKLRRHVLYEVLQKYLGSSVVAIRSCFRWFGVSVKTDASNNVSLGKLIFDKIPLELSFGIMIMS